MYYPYKNVSLIDWNFLPSSEWLTTSEIEQQLSDLYSKLHLSKGRLELMTGIKKRGVFPMGTLPSDLAYEASIPILEKLNSLNIHRSHIDLIIYAGVSRDCLEPSTASRVHHRAQLESHCRNFDLSNACLGFMSSTELASQLIESGQIRYALICSGENASPLLQHTLKTLMQAEKINRQDLKKAFASLTIGSGAAAWLLGPRNQHPHLPRITFTQSYAHTQATYLCEGDGNKDGMWMKTEAEELLNQGLVLAEHHWKDLEKHGNWVLDYQHLFMHQVGRAHELASTQLLKLDPSKQWSIYEEYGNMGSVALPATLMLAHKSNRIKKQDKILLLGIGSGLNSLICGIEW